MRWSMVRLIWLRELRDQLRDRRTVFMIAVLPLVLYPVLGVAVLQFTLAGIADNSAVVGIEGSEHLPPAVSPARAADWVALPPTGSVADRLLAAARLQAVARWHDYPPLLVGDRFNPALRDLPGETSQLQVKRVSDGKALLESRKIDVLLKVPPDCAALLEQGGRPRLEVSSRDKDERSQLAARRLSNLILPQWRQLLREVRLHRHGLSMQVIDVYELHDPENAKSTEKLAAEGLLDLLLKIFPFLLVMWSLAGALYPAVDLCAGEKERGTMETLLISPAGRQEIVLGKFLTIWVFSAATALLNLASMGVTFWLFSRRLTQAGGLGGFALFWCVLLLLPLSAFFSALCLAVGAYARSTKEGQYYLMPLFLVTMPLVFLTLAPGVELSPFYSLVPVTGVALLLRRLMEKPLSEVPWLYFLPVLAPIVLYSWLALRWAIEQFKREEVLFREAERLDLALWFRRLLREKEAIPTVGEALFCFALVVALRWLSFSWGTQVSSLTHTGITLVAFVAAPTLFMAVVLTTRPLQGLALTWPKPRYFLTALLLALVLLWPFVELSLYVLSKFPDLKQLLSEGQPLLEALKQLQETGSGLWWYSFILAVLPALSEELLFRGFLLTGLRRRFQPWTAIFLSSLLFGLYHLNAFNFLPALVVGIVLGLLTVRSGSVLPAMLYHLIHNGVQIYLTGGPSTAPLPLTGRVALTALCSVLAAVILWRLARQPAAAVPPDA